MVSEIIDLSNNCGLHENVMNGNLMKCRCETIYKKYMFNAKIEKVKKYEQKRQDYDLSPFISRHAYHLLQHSPDDNIFQSHLPPNHIILTKLPSHHHAAISHIFRREADEKQTTFSASPAQPVTGPITASYRQAHRPLGVLINSLFDLTCFAIFKLRVCFTE